MTTSSSSESSSSAVAQARAPNWSASDSVACEFRSKQPRSVSRPSAPARLRPTSPQPMMPTRSGLSDGADLRVLNAVAALELEIETKLERSCRRQCQPGVVGASSVDQKEPATACSNELAPDHAASA